MRTRGPAPAHSHPDDPRRDCDSRASPNVEADAPASHHGQEYTQTKSHDEQEVASEVQGEGDHAEHEGNEARDECVREGGWRSRRAQMLGFPSFDLPNNRRLRHDDAECNAIPCLGAPGRAATVIEESKSHCAVADHYDDYRCC